MSHLRITSYAKSAIMLFWTLSAVETVGTDVKMHFVAAILTGGSGGKVVAQCA